MSDVNSSLKDLARQVLSYPGIGAPASLAFRAIGAEAVGQKISRLCGHVPEIVSVRLPGALQVRGSFRLYSVCGRDQVARRVWRWGWDGYEAPVTSIFAQAARDAGGVVDIGANTGFYSLAAATCSQTATVHAFEPFPPALDCIRSNVRLNRLEPRIAVFPVAVSDEVGRSTLYIPANDRQGIETSCSLNRDFRTAHSASVEVETVTLDGHLTSHPELRIDVIKVDVESQEHRVLAGSRIVLREHRPLLFVEVLASADCEALEAIRRAHGYAALTVSGPRVSRSDAVRPDPESKMQVWCAEEKLSAFAESLRQLQMQPVW